MYRLQKPRLWVLIALLAVTICAMFFIKECSHKVPQAIFQGGAYPPKAKGDTLDVAIEISPLVYSLAGDTATGLDYNIMRLIEQKYNQPVKFHPYAPLQWALKGLENGNFDVLIGSLPSTVQLKTAVPLTIPIYIDRQILIQNVPDSLTITAPEQLAGLEVWISKGSPVAERIHNLSAEIGDTIIIRGDEVLTPEHLIMMVGAGKIPRAVVPQGAMKNLQSVYPSINSTVPISFSQFQAWAVTPKKPDLLNALNKRIEEIKTTPQYNLLIKQ